MLGAVVNSQYRVSQTGSGCTDKDLIGSIKIKTKVWARSFEGKLDVAEILEAEKDTDTGKFRYYITFVD